MMFYNVCVWYCTINFQNFKIKDVTKMNFLINKKPSRSNREKRKILFIIFAALEQLMNID